MTHVGAFLVLDEPNKGGSLLTEYSVASLVFDSLQPHGLYPPRLLCPWGSSNKNTGVGCHSLLQFLVQEQNKIKVALGKLAHLETFSYLR